MYCIAEHLLRDPNYNDWDEANRTAAARGQFLRRILRALERLKGTVKQAVANFFANCCTQL